LRKPFCWLTIVFAVSAYGAERPRIVGIANIAVKVDNLAQARQSYSGEVDMTETFATKDSSVVGDLICFKVK
jgi:hypothetical protein